MIRLNFTRDEGTGRVRFTDKDLRRAYGDVKSMNMRAHVHPDVQNYCANEMNRLAMDLKHRWTQADYEVCLKEVGRENPHLFFFAVLPRYGGHRYDVEPREADDRE